MINPKLYWLLALLMASANVVAEGRAPIDVQSLGAKCDGTTDDSKALQAALSASITNKVVLTLPSGICYFKTGLSTAKGPHIRGQGEMGAGASILRYGGSGTALTIGANGAWIYTPVLEDFAIQSTGNAAIGLRCDTCSDARLDNLTIGGDPSSYFAVALDLSNSNGVFINHPIISYNGDAVRLVDTSAIDIQRGDFYAIKGSVLQICGKSIWDSLRFSFVETVDFAIKIDDSICSSPTTVETLNVTGNALLFNGGADKYKHQVSVNVTNSEAGRRFTVNQLLFIQNHVLMASGLTATTYPISVSLAQGQRGYVNIVTADNFFAGALQGTLPCTTGSISLISRDNRSYSASGTAMVDKCGTAGDGR